MSRAVILTLPWGGAGQLDTPGWHALHPARPSRGELDPNTLTVVNPLLVRIAQERLNKLVERWSGEMGPVYFSYWLERLGLR